MPLNMPDCVPHTISSKIKIQRQLLPPKPKIFASVFIIIFSSKSIRAKQYVQKFIARFILVEQFYVCFVNKI